jgi:hypothetical protein
MDIKVGAGGDVQLTMTPAGDVQLAFTEVDTLTNETVNVILHPTILAATLTKILGGSPFAAGIVNFAISELPTIIAALPSA